MYGYETERREQYSKTCSLKTNHFLTGVANDKLAFQKLNRVFSVFSSARSVAFVAHFKAAYVSPCVCGLT